MVQLCSRFQVRALAYDRWRIETFKMALADEGVTDLEMIEHGQGYRDMAPAVDIVERMVAEWKPRHANNPILTWCMSNAVVTSDPAGNGKLDKSRATGGSTARWRSQWPCTRWRCSRRRSVGAVD